MPSDKPADDIILPEAGLPLAAPPGPPSSSHARVQSTAAPGGGAGPGRGAVTCTSTCRGARCAAREKGRGGACSRPFARARWPGCGSGVGGPPGMGRRGARAGLRAGAEDAPSRQLRRTPLRPSGPAVGSHTSRIKAGSDCRPRTVLTQQFPSSLSGRGVEEGRQPPRDGLGAGTSSLGRPRPGEVTGRAGGDTR